MVRNVEIPERITKIEDFEFYLTVLLSNTSRELKAEAVEPVAIDVIRNYGKYWEKWIKDYGQ